ncbi:copper amine oxidase N-terminal domain-containing protein [Peptococcaceae bacterium 1198_IL3148]
MFKKFLSKVFVSSCLVLSLTTIAAADQPTEQVDVYHDNQLVTSVVFKVDSNQYFVNNQTPGTRMDASPFIEQGRTFVPVRYLGNALGVTNENIAWNGSTNKAALTLGDKTAELTIGKKQIVATGQTKLTDVAPMLKTGRTYLPARYVAEALGYQVAWDATNGMVIAYPAGQEQPDISTVVDFVGGQLPKVPEVPEVPVQPQVPTGTIDEIVAKAMPFSGQPFSFDGWNFAEGWEESLQYDPMTREKINLKFQKVTVDELRQSNGIHIGDTSVIHDVKITDEGVYTTQSSIYHTGLGFILVEEGNIIRYNYSTNPDMQGTTETTFAAKKHIRGGTYKNPLPTPDMNKVTGVLFQYGDKLLHVDVKGGK